VGADESGAHRHQILIRGLMRRDVCGAQLVSDALQRTTPFMLAVCEARDAVLGELQAIEGLVEQQGQ
jgi:hypothetical protein